MKLIFRYIIILFFFSAFFSMFTTCKKKELGDYVVLGNDTGDAATEWVQVGDPFDGICYDLIVFNDSLWLAGNFNYVGLGGSPKTEGCMKWDGCNYTRVNYYYDGKDLRNMQFITANYLGANQFLLSIVNIGQENIGHAQEIIAWVQMSMRFSHIIMSYM